jgi:hypothetical protein
MKLISVQVMANSAAEWWKRNYFHSLHGWSKNHPECEQIYARLSALPRPVDPDEVTSIIGNKRWFEPITCTECANAQCAVVEFANEEEYDMPTVCKSCLTKATEMIGGDDSAYPITEEWLQSLSFGQPGKHWGVISARNDGTYWTDASAKIQLKTRRDVRILCELMRIELKEGK